MIQHLWLRDEPLCGRATARPYVFNSIAESNEVPVCTRCHRLSLVHQDRDRYASHLTPTRWWARAYAVSSYWSLVFLTGCMMALAASVWRLPALIYAALGVMLFSVVLNAYRSESSATDPRPGEAAAGAAMLVAGVLIGLGAGVYLGVVLS